MAVDLQGVMIVLKVLTTIGEVLILVVGFLMLPVAPIVSILFFLSTKLVPLLQSIFMILPTPVAVALVAAVALVVIWVVIKILRDFL